MGRVVIEGKRKLTVEEREEVKGAVMIPVDYDADPKTNWELTAEIGTSIFPEAIVDGLKNKVGDRKTKGIGEEILKFFVCLPIPLVAPHIAFLADSSSTGQVEAMRGR